MKFLSMVLFGFISLTAQSQSVLTYRNCYDFLVNGVIESKKTTNNLGDLPPFSSINTELFQDSIVSKQIFSDGDSVDYLIHRKTKTTYIQAGQSNPLITYSYDSLSIRYPFMDLPVRYQPFQGSVFSDSINYQNATKYSGSKIVSNNIFIIYTWRQLFVSNAGGPFNFYRVDVNGWNETSHIPTRIKAPNQTVFDTIVLSPQVNVATLIFNQLEVFPNPVNDQPFVMSAEWKGAAIYLSDLQGRKTEISSNWDGSPIPTNEWKPGVYFLQVFKGNEDFRSVKIIKTK